MANQKDASFDMIVKMCETVGWDKGIESLEKIVWSNENLQAELFSDPEKTKQAMKLTQTIIAQNMTIAKLKKIRPTP